MIPGRGWRALVGLGRRSELSVAAVIVAMIAVIAFGSVAAPRQLVDAESNSLDLAIDQAPPGGRQLSIRLIEEFGVGTTDDPLGDPRSALDAIADDIDPGLLARFGPARIVADSGRFGVVGVDLQDRTEQERELPPEQPPLPTFLTFRVHPELDGVSELVAGRAAGPTDREIEGHPVIEYELTPAAAAELGWELGDAVLLTTDPTDLVTRQFSGRLPSQFVAVLVGLRELTPPDDPYWFRDARLHRPTVADTGIGANVFAFATIHPEQLPTRPFMVDRRSPFLLEQRRDLIDGAVTVDRVDDTLAGLTALGATFGEQPTLTRPGVSSGLDSVLRIEQDQRRAARATLVLAAVGVFGVALATLGQLLLTSFARRRAALTVARARGASRPQLVVAAIVEVGSLALLGIALGGGAAVLLAGGSPSDLERPLLVGLWLGAVGVAGSLAAVEGMRPATVSGRLDAHPGLGRWGRVAGWLLVVVAVAAVVTFRRRGVATGAAGPDPLVVLLPIVVPLASVHATRWLLPLALRQATGRGLAMGPGRLVGLRRAAAQPEATVGVGAVLALSLTVGALGLGVNRSLDQGAADASWRAVGAPYRLDTRDVATARRVAAVPGAVVAASGSTRVNLDRDDTTFNLQLITIDVPGIRRITAGTAADASYPDALDRPDEAGRIPAIASRRMGGSRIRVGDELIGLGARAGQRFVVVETRAEAFGRRNDWLIADRSVFASVAGVEAAFNTLAIDVPPDGVADLTRIAEDAGEQLDDRSVILRLQRDDPLARAVRQGYLLSAAAAAALALLALVAVAVVTARERRREIAVLGLLGADRREISRAVASELVPAILGGVAIGAAVGWLVVRSYDGRYDLSAFAAGSPVSIRNDLFGLVALGAAVVVVAVATIALLARRIVRARASEILRIEGAA